MNQKLSFRIIVDILLVVSVLNAWWFILIPLTVIGAWAFPYFIESILVGIAYDALFALAPGMGWKGYAGTIISIIILAGVFFLKKVVRR